jgi:TonB family protein
MRATQQTKRAHLFFALQRRFTEGLQTMRKLFPLFLVASILLCLVIGCSKFFNRYKCSSTAVANPKSAEDYIKIAQDHDQRREWDCSHGACDEAVRLDPKNASAYVCRGRTSNNEAAKMQDYARAIELDPNSTLAYAVRSIAYEYQDKPDLAIKDLEMVVKLCGNDCDGGYVAKVHRKLGDLYMGRNDFDSAVLDFTESIRLAPEVASSYTARATANRKLERHEAADADSVKAAELEYAQFGAKLPERITLGILNYRATNLPQPPYPQSARDKGESGDVEISVEINEAGQVTKAWGQTGSWDLHETAIPAAERVRFKPLLINGQPAKFTGRLRYTFAAPK